MFDVGESERLDMGWVYAVVSAKGGVGKTTTTTNLAAALAASGADVAVVDGDLGMANLAGSLGVDSSGATLHDVLAGEAELDEATREGPHGMAVVPGSPDLDAFARADPEGLEAVLSELGGSHDYVLLDTGAGLSNDTVVPLTYVDEALLVSTTGRDALGDTEKTRQVAERLDVPVAGVVVTRANPDDPGTGTVESTLDATVLAVIPRADVVRNAGDAGEPLTTFAPGSPAAAAYRALAADLTGEPLPEAHAPPETDPAAEDADAESTGDATADHEDIIVAGDHEADGERDDESDPPEAVAAATADGAATGSDEQTVDEEATGTDDPLADPTADSDADAGSAPSLDEDPLVEVGGVPGDDAAPAPDADAADEPLVQTGAVGGVSVDGSAVDDPTDDEPADDDPLIETAEPVDGDTTDDHEATDADSDAMDADSDAMDADPDATDADAEPADVEADESETDDADESEGTADDGEEGVYTTSLADAQDEPEEKEEKKGLFGRFLG
jgi:septum site-determining protein MinD